MNSSERIDENWTLKKLDAFLGNKLLNHAHVLAEVLMESFGGYPIFGMKKSEIDSELAYIDKIRAEIMNCYRDYVKKYPIFKGYEETKGQKEKDDFIINKFLLKPHFEFLSQREEELKQYKKIFSSKEARGISPEKKFKIASIWALMLRRRKRIVWPDVVRLSTGQIRVRSSIWKKIVSSADWPNIVGLLDWFHNKLKDTIYGKELELSYKIKKYEGRVKYLKRRCSLIIKKDVVHAISSFRIFIPEGLPVEKRLIPYSIKFNEKSIEVTGIYKRSFDTRKVDFKKNKKFFSGDHSIPAQSSSITFPNGEIFKALPTWEILSSALSYLSGLKFL